MKNQIRDFKAGMQEAKRTVNEMAHRLALKMVREKYRYERRRKP